MTRVVFVLCVAVLQAVPAAARKPAGDIDSFVDARADTWAQVALQIWDWAELGYKEERSSALAARRL